MAGDTAPAYGALSLVGDSIDFAELRGRALLVNVWATWCGPCRAEMPELQELHEQYGDDLSVIGVSIDQAGDQDLIEGFLEDVGIDFTILLDPEGRVTRRFTTIGVPETFLIDAEGIVRKRWVGRFMPHAPANLSVIEGALQSDS
jgi:thiol-disulfide isomerase/thioredoxin